MKAPERKSPPPPETGNGPEISAKRSTEDSTTPGPLLSKWLLLEQAARDDRLTARSDYRVLIAVLSRMNNTLEAWPGFGRIAKDTNQARSTVATSIKRLAQFGYLIKSREGDQASNHYKLGSPNDRTSTNARTSPNGRTEVVRETGLGSPNARTGVVRALGPEPVTLNPLQESDKENQSQKTVCRFDEFWSAYPRKERKKGAQTAWKRHRLDGKADEIIADIERSRGNGKWRGSDLKFCPLPTTYLNGARWEDEWTASADHSSLPRDTDEEAAEVNAEAARRAEGW